MIAPKPASRPDKVSLLRYLRLFRADILSAQPARLYRAWMAEFRTPFFRSYLCNDPDLIDRVLKECPADFPKSDRVREGLRPLLGRSVFVTNGAEWSRQRRIIDPAFAGGRLHQTFPAMLGAADSARDRMAARVGTVVEVEEEASHAAADVIFRTLFSIPIEHQAASGVFHAFRRYQRAQPLLNLAAFLPLPRWVPRFHRPGIGRAAREIRGLIARLTTERATEIAAGTAPDDLATKIMTTADPETGARFDADEMVDQVAIFFLAGHETSASALAWALYLLAADPDHQARVAAEAREVLGETPVFADVARLKLARDTFREVLRLYPPVPMMVREARCPARFRDRAVPRGAQIVISPWHVHRHERLWDRPDDFDPGRWQSPEGRDSARRAFLPFSAGPRVCPGAGFAMIEGPLLLALLVRDLEFSTEGTPPPVPVAHLTVRSQAGIPLRVSVRQ
ncbi:cytochrome P450 [Defluviimonas aestuarii]|uniref:cytochrome P450 n=1 Tax=Albidovulum aestuarii TaxID=1130726 RepID=UPI00249BB55C|nr:cytochrome P450 [Defluviimonas aestuarii]MDI3335123.1 cytochrome P450 [Defluviimonas aestuarii]